MYIYTYYSIKILDKKVPTLKEIPRSALTTARVDSRKMKCHDIIKYSTFQICGSRVIV